MMVRYLTFSLILAASAFSQSTDITGWSDLRWGTTKPVALKTLQPLGAHECNPTNGVQCAEVAGADVLLIEKYDFNKVPFTVNLLFTSKIGLTKVIMTAEDKRGAFEKVLSELTVRYGRPGTPQPSVFSRSSGAPPPTVRRTPSCPPA